MAALKKKSILTKKSALEILKKKAKKAAEQSFVDIHLKPGEKLRIGGEEYDVFEEPEEGEPLSEEFKKAAAEKRTLDEARRSEMLVTLSKVEDEALRNRLSKWIKNAPLAGLCEKFSDNTKPAPAELYEKAFKALGAKPAEFDI